jgi:hypothetical protein
MSNSVHSFFLRLHTARKHQNIFLATKGIKIQMSTMDYKEEAKIWMKKPKLDENRIKIGENFTLHP